ncbi:Uncharacterised protein [Mycobacteroides abscessus subsp. abscessus]|uniref:hypothetical protein n=1 Tax=Mycobacteroides abscessus TaxID=36809 RepID=UPI0009296C46|nr:hypothetical protein [Mycobacteroides abscessus]SIH20773.1 Uncharacterised protein [Mycobacteroides abscessus subsp. abscessus]
MPEIGDVLPLLIAAGAYLGWRLTKAGIKFSMVAVTLAGIAAVAALSSSGVL